MFLEFSSLESLFCHLWNLPFMKATTIFFLLSLIHEKLLILFNFTKSTCQPPKSIACKVQQRRFPFSESPCAIQTRCLVPFCFDYQSHFQPTKQVAILLNHYLSLFLILLPTPNSILHKPQKIGHLNY